MRICLQPSFSIAGPDGDDAIDRHLRLLAEVERHGNLRMACERLGMSYRSGWDMVGALERRVGGQVLDMQRGRGSSLTELGQRLVWALKLVHARFEPLLDSMAAEIDAQVQLTLARGQSYLRIFASHGYAIATLNAHLQRVQAPVELGYRGSVEALHALARGSCDVAGFPIPVGQLQPVVVARMQALLKDGYRVITVTARHLGLMVRKGNPSQVWTIGDLARPGVRFVNRQQGSGTRMILELLLERAGLPGADIDGMETVELTHAAIAAYIASGKADAGLGVEAAARQFDLDFVPVLTERYFLVCNESTLADPRFAATLAYLQGPEFRTSLLEYPGYDGAEAGRIATLAEAFH
ncbi:substrate-binding domain-containing protein [Janthinobacterium sp. PC23-8]|uniref:helix-turn-helix transcriptional regulator n=1 Tax=Janthinobacterium sp. PC23-8 TaxID=2012679 RepID=UPI000B96AC72|nr:substrate-binding domain-containing protein [Janthinobacterium sp. PC23-8]OYO29271.1 hypothetical protein CD932_19505 [Janthinobacterium sp. PC23-8]